MAAVTTHKFDSSDRNAVSIYIRENEASKKRSNLFVNTTKLWEGQCAADTQMMSRLPCSNFVSHLCFFYVDFQTEAERSHLVWNMVTTEK